MRILFVLSLLLCMPHAAFAQGDELEYKLDVGGGIGVATAIGDASGLLGSIGPEGGFVIRRIFNPRMALKTSVSAMRLSGETDGYFPTDATSGTPQGGNPASLKWKRMVMDASCMYEHNFWGFGSGPEYKGNKRITPYMAAGVGLTVATGCGGKAATALNIPFAVGLKYKLKPRLNLELEWNVHFTTTDRIDDNGDNKLKLDDPFGIKSGMFKNKDCYSAIQVSVTYDMKPKLRKCNN